MSRCAVSVLVVAGLLLLLLLPGRRAAAAVAEDTLLNYCSELKAQSHLDLKEVMGKWYVVEIVEHKLEGRAAAGAGSGYGGYATARVLINACPVVQLRWADAPGSRDGPPRMRLLWEESIGALEYTFWVSKNRGPGVWNSDYPQNGTLANEPTYKQFVGTVHVMKAVASHMVLTFCARDSAGQKFSILVGRTHRLPRTDLLGVHKLLERRNLQLLSIRESCANGAAHMSLLRAPWLLPLLLLLGLLAYRTASDRAFE